MQVSTDNGATWVEVGSVAVRFSIPHDTEDEVGEESNLILKVTAEGMVIDLVGMNSGEVVTTTYMEQNDIAELPNKV